MTGRTVDALIMYGCAGLLLTSALFAGKGLKAQYLHLAPNGFALRRPWEQCACLGVMALLSLLYPLIPAGDDLRFYGAVRPDHWSSLWALAGIGLAGAALFLWAGRPEQLVLDKDRHTYRYTKGWPPLQRQCTGPWSDLEGIGAEESCSSHGGYLVCVYWQSGKDKMVVGRFRSVDRTDNFAGELASLLGVSHLPWPNPYQGRSEEFASMLGMAHLLPPGWHRPYITTDMRPMEPGETHTRTAYRRGRRWRRRLD